jgi:hypothetical protein
MLQNECISGSILWNLKTHLWGDIPETPTFMKYGNERYFSNIPQNDHFLHYDDVDNLPVFRFYLLIRDSAYITLDTEILENTKVDVYPNPFINKFTISSDLPLSDIYVTDLIGNKIDFEIQNSTISLSNDEAKGIYILSFFQAGKRYFYKMMKQ